MHGYAWGSVTKLVGYWACGPLLLRRWRSVRSACSTRLSGTEPAAIDTAGPEWMTRADMGI